MQYLIATTSEVVHLIALRAVHSIPLQEVHLSRYWHDIVRNDVPAKYDNIDFEFDHGFFVFKWQGNLGISTVNDEIAMSPQYKYIFFHNSDVYVERWSGESFRVTWEELKSLAKQYKEKAAEDARKKARTVAEIERKKHLVMLLSSFKCYLEENIKTGKESTAQWLTKGEFETSAAYFERTCGASLVAKYNENFIESKKEFIAMHDSLLRTDTECRFKLGSYNADEQSFEISSKFLAPFQIKVDIDDAPIFKKMFSTLKKEGLTLDIIDDKAMCTAVTFVDEANNMTYPYQADNKAKTTKHYIRNFATLIPNTCNIKKGSYSTCPHVVTLLEPEEEMIPSLIQTNGYVTIKGNTKYGGSLLNPNLHYHIWVDGKQIPVELRVNRHKYYESFSFIIKKNLGHNYVFVVEDSEGNVSAPIEIETNGIQQGL